MYNATLLLFSQLAVFVLLNAQFCQAQGERWMGNKLLVLKKPKKQRNALTCKVLVSHIFKVLSNELDVNIPVS